MAQGYALRIVPTENRGEWEGWGTSVSWWGVAVGDSALLADALFTSVDQIAFPDGTSVPGLGLNIVRYNVGGCGRVQDGAVVKTHEKNTGEAWYKTVEGYWINWIDKNPSSSSWDWTRDERQRRAIALALERGQVSHVELFHAAPMWWMTKEKTAFGGDLQKWNVSDFALYSATVAEHVVGSLKWPVRSLAILNEPSASWWRPGHKQEGCSVDKKMQQELLKDLATEINSRPALQGRVRIAGCDENDVKTALKTYKGLKPGSVGQVNVHGFDGGAGPNRDSAARRELRGAVNRHIPLWVSAYTDKDGGGMALAQSITQDITNLQPTAWVYWQAVEALNPDVNASGWGLINANFGISESDPLRGSGARVNTKYYIMAQFTRYIRPGVTILGSDDSNTICAYDAKHQVLICVTANAGPPKSITYDLSRFSQCAGTGTVVFTNANGRQRLATSGFTYYGQCFSYPVEADSVYTLIFNGVVL